LEDQLFLDTVKLQVAMQFLKEFFTKLYKVNFEFTETIQP